MVIRIINVVIHHVADTLIPNQRNTITRKYNNNGNINVDTNELTTPEIVLQNRITTNIEVRKDMFKVQQLNRVGSVLFFFNCMHN